MSPNSDYRYVSKRNYKAFNLPCCPPVNGVSGLVHKFKGKKVQAFCFVIIFPAAAAAANEGTRTQTRRRPLMTALTAVKVLKVLQDRNKGESTKYISFSHQS